ncbi:Solute carrier family 23 member 2 [Holothuria leucospilota]|uniref:Solute carrier family 23 member 2 n=1 Tax=Holothuria leucospilota TaxID=206669 RepID=A0A9Q1C4K7_HOLLE|nr:Solute carrier family 23 member 2 [Holothuria leucospilota]
MEENIEQSHEADDKRNQEEEKPELVYGIEDRPPILQLTVLGLQQFLSMCGAQVVIPLILAEILCMKTDVIAVSYVISATFLMQGITTFLQSTFGSRLPIIQGSSFSFIPPSIALMAFYGGCPELGEGRNTS